MGTDMPVRHQEVEILEGLSTSQKAQGHHLDAMQIVRDPHARIEVKKEEECEHVRRDVQLQSVVEAQMKEIIELRGRLNRIALAFECPVCFEKLGAGSVSFGCGHTYCHRPTCGSSMIGTCPECSRTVTTRVRLFGALSHVGGLLEHESAVPDVEQVQKLAAENAKASLEEIRKRSEKDKAVWQREKEEMQRQVNRLEQEVLAEANDKASLEKICKRRDEDKAVWQHEKEEAQRQVKRLQQEVLAAANDKASLEKIRKKREKDKAAWQREKEEMQRQVKWLQEEVLSAANDKASLEEMRKRRDEDKAAWQHEKEEMQGKVNRCVNRLRVEVLAAENAKASLEEMRKKEVLAAEKATASLEEMCKRREGDKAVWQREREEMQRQANWEKEALERKLQGKQTSRSGQTYYNSETKQSLLTRPSEMMATTFKPPLPLICASESALQLRLRAAEDGLSIAAAITSSLHRERQEMKWERGEMLMQLNMLREENVALKCAYENVKALSNDHNLFSQPAYLPLEGPSNHHSTHVVWCWQCSRNR